MGCTDILGISEIRTGAKMIYIGVGPEPLKQSGKGGWEEDGAQLSRRRCRWRPMLQAPSLGRGPWSHRWSCCLHQTGFLMFPGRTFQATSLGIIGILDYPFQKKGILSGFLGCEFYVSART